MNHYTTAQYGQWIKWTTTYWWTCANILLCLSVSSCFPARTSLLPKKVDTFLRKSVDSEDSQTPLKPQNENENLILAARTKSTENMKVNMTCQTSQTYVEVNGFRSEKGTRLAIGSVLRASFAALSTASFPWILICPGTHIKRVSFLSALILCRSFCICISRGWWWWWWVDA